MNCNVAGRSSTGCETKDLFIPRLAFVVAARMCHLRHMHHLYKAAYYSGSLVLIAQLMAPLL